MFIIYWGEGGYLVKVQDYFFCFAVILNAAEIFFYKITFDIVHRKTFFLEINSWILTFQTRRNHTSYLVIFQ